MFGIAGTMRLDHRSVQHRTPIDMVDAVFHHGPDDTDILIRGTRKLNAREPLEYRVTGDETLDEVAYSQLEPFGSPLLFMGWHIFRVAIRQGCGAALNGRAGDEALLGYERYSPLELDPAHTIDFIKRFRAQSRLLEQHLLDHQLMKASVSISRAISCTSAGPNT